MSACRKQRDRERADGCWGWALFCWVYHWLVMGQYNGDTSHLLVVKVDIRQVMLDWRLDLKEVQSSKGAHGSVGSPHQGDVSFHLLLHRGGLLNYRVIMPFEFC